MNAYEERTGRSLASRFKHRFVYALISLGGRPLAYLFLYPLVLVYCLYPSVRDKSRAYVMRRFDPQTKWDFFKHTFRLNLTFGRTLVDRAALGILGAAEFKADPQARQTCERLIKQGKGLLLLTAHVGCWQSAVNCMQFLNTPMHILYYRNPKDNDKTVAQHSGKEAPFTFINPAEPLGGVPEMMAALSRGEIVCAMADRVFGNPQNAVEVDFLGGKIRVPYSFYRLAAATQAPVVIAFFPWEGIGKLASWVFNPIYVEDEGPSKQHYQPYAQQFIDGLTQFCIKYPYQFFNYFDWWNDYATTNNR
ncbi:MAG: lysophospholipid acyltransferase family protein [Elusimicrobiaceae bacterium]|nr:lysophospholipid acyltransferase family protein [Elusimicrobiaceae bacterium]